MKEAVINACWNAIGIKGDKSCPQLKRHTHCRNCDVFAASAAILLDRPAPGDYCEEWTERIGRPNAPKLAGTKPVVIFRIGAEWLALPTAAIMEVADLRPVHSLPHRSLQLVKGVVNIRGELLICFSLAGLLGFEASADTNQQNQRTTYQRMLVIGNKNGRSVFCVDEVHVGHRYHPNELKPVPATLSLASPLYTTGLLSWREHTVGVLDDGLVFHTINRNLA